MIRKTSDLKNYDDLLADVIFHAGIPLERQKIGKFLYDTGYIGKIPIDRQLNAILALVTVRV